MSETSPADDAGSNLMRWLVLLVLAAVAAAVGRQVALSKADKEFEARLLAADERRN